MKKEFISTTLAPKAIGTYSQGVKIDSMVFLSGQIPLNPRTMELVSEFPEQVHQVFKNLQSICVAAGGSLSDIVKLTIYLTDLSHFSMVNEIMPQYFDSPYPARAVIGVRELPKGAAVEMDAILYLAKQN